MISAEQLQTYIQRINFPILGPSPLTAEILLQAWEQHLSAIPISSINLHIARGYTKQPIELDDDQALFKNLVERKKPAIGYESLAVLLNLPKLTQEQAQC